MTLKAFQAPGCKALTFAIIKVIFYLSRVVCRVACYFRTRPKVEQLVIKYRANSRNIFKVLPPCPFFPFCSKFVLSSKRCCPSFIKTIHATIFARARNGLACPWLGAYVTKWKVRDFVLHNRKVKMLFRSIPPRSRVTVSLPLSLSLSRLASIFSRRRCRVNRCNYFRWSVSWRS